VGLISFSRLLKVHFERLSILADLSGKVMQTNEVNVCGCDLLNQTELLSRHCRILDPAFFSNLVATVMDPWTHMSIVYMENGTLSEKSSREFFVQEGNQCPEMFRKAQHRIISVGESVKMMKEMREPMQSDKLRTFDSLWEKIDYYYENECPRLVNLILWQWKGLETAAAMRGSIIEDEVPEFEVQWPISELICSALNLERCRNVQIFLGRLKACRLALSRKNRLDLEPSVFVRFRQKSLHVISAILNSIWLRLEEENWENFVQGWQKSVDYRELTSMFGSYVLKLSDICFQNKVSSPLRNAVEKMISCCDLFCNDRFNNDVEKDFDGSLYLFTKLLAGVLQQRKIFHLKSLLSLIGDAKP
jgi:hypothetical protein